MNNNNKNNKAVVNNTKCCRKQEFQLKERGKYNEIKMKSKDKTQNQVNLREELPLVALLSSNWIRGWDYKSIYL